MFELGTHLCVIISAFFDQNGVNYGGFMKDLIKFYY